MEMGVQLAAPVMVFMLILLWNGGDKEEEL